MFISVLPRQGRHTLALQHITHPRFAKLPEKNTLFWPGRIHTSWAFFEIVFSPPAPWDKVVCASAQQYLIYNPLNTSRKETCLVQVNRLCEDLGSILLLQQVQGCAEQDIERGQLQLHGSLLHLDLAMGTQPWGHSLRAGSSESSSHLYSVVETSSQHRCKTAGKHHPYSMHIAQSNPFTWIYMFILSHKVKTRGNSRKLKDTTIKNENRLFPPDKLSWRTPCLKILLLCQLATLYKN